MNTDNLNKILKNVSTFEDIELSDIPCIDLYMDQVTTLFENKLHNQKRDPKDKILTKTMINNYSKAKILIPPKNKQYSKEHIILLNLIYNLKQTLSINDISMLLSPLVSNMSDENKDNSLDDLYKMFLQIKKNESSSFEENFNSKFESLKNEFPDIESENNKTNFKELILTVLMLINESNLKKRMAEKIIDNFFNENNEEIKSKKK